MSSIWLQKRTFIALVLSFLALTEILDMTIVSVGLPHMMGAVGANTQQISWVLTSYVTSAAVCMPLTGMITKKFGRKQILLISVFIFTLSSVLCGTSTTLGEIVFYRLLQGVGGAFLPPIAQSYIIDNFTKEEQPRIMSLYSMSIILGPILGPVIGGVITENINWRWMFYVNVPICIIGFIVILYLMPKTKPSKVNIDIFSFLFFITGIGLLELFLNEGNNLDWFNSRYITMSLVFGIIFIGFFIWRGLLGKTIIDFDIFKDKNFSIASFITICFFGAVMIVFSYLPVLLETFLNYPADKVGLLSMPRGIAAFIAVPITLKLNKYIDSKYIIMMGILCFITSDILLINFSPNQDSSVLLMPYILQGIGMTSTMIMILIKSYSTLAPHLISTAAGTYSYLRNIGNSIGTAIGATIVTTTAQHRWHSLSGYISPYHEGYKIWMQNAPLKNENLIHMIHGRMVGFQSSFISFINSYYFSMIVLCAVFFLPLLLTKENLKK